MSSKHRLDGLHLIAWFFFFVFMFLFAVLIVHYGTNDLPARMIEPDIEQPGSIGDYLDPLRLRYDN